jgi:hypothetical protein
MSQPASTAESAAPPIAKAHIRRLAWLLLAAGTLALLAGITIFATSSHLAGGEQDELSQFVPVECFVLKKQINYLPRNSEEDEFRLRPQLLVRYQLGENELEGWIDAGPEMDVDASRRAQLMVEALPGIGQTVTCWYEADDPTTLHYQIGDGGRRTWLIGIAMGAFTLLPGLGLVIAAWLLWRYA